MAQVQDGAGHTVSSAPSSSTNYSLPGVLTPGGNSNLATTVNYASSWAVTSVSGPNGASGSTTYDNYGRPQSQSIPDGASTAYTYAYVGVGGATANTQTAQLGTGTGARWKKTTLDGFGRVTRVETGHDSTTVSQVDTQYAACACSPLGKLWRTSQPYAPGGTPVWTTYAYDGSGRTLSVTAPDGSVSTTQYLTTVTDPASNVFTGNMVKSTDPAGKWKIQRSDGLGNMVQVLEPNPDTASDGRYVKTDYTYNVLGQMTQVLMRRYAPGSSSNYTDQTRTFVYTGSDLTSATNPETGTVTYQYDGSHRATKKTDAKGQETRYSYDAYGRLTQVQHWAWGYQAQALQEIADERIDYYYDTNPCDGSFSQNAWGRLTAVNFTLNGYNSGCRYQYSYNQAGRVLAQKMAWTMQDATSGTQGYAMTAGYEWDNEGRMTSLTYPALSGTGTKYTYQFDAMGRTNGMTDTGSSSSVANATFGVAGEIVSMGYFGFNETRTYNNMFQMTRVTATAGPPTVMDMQYVLGAGGTNNGRITKSIDGITGETVDYTYDVWNRLTKAETEGTTGVQWGQSFTYDGFGNLTAKGATKGSVPTFSTTINPATNGGPTSYTPTAFDGSRDVEDRPIHGNNGTTYDYNYDQAGKRVMSRLGGGAYWFAGTWEFAMYGLGGQRLFTVSCTYPNNMNASCAAAGKNIYFGGKLVVSRGVTVATDRLGTVRANSNGESFAYYPYGEERTSTADGREKFGTYVRDGAGQDYADQRYYNVGAGRFDRPDLGLSGLHLRAPQSWNRYTYTLGDPINHIDPNGRSCIDEGGYWVDDGDEYGCEHEGEPTGYNGGDSGLYFNVTGTLDVDKERIREFVDGVVHGTEHFDDFMLAFAGLSGGAAYTMASFMGEAAFSLGADTLLLGDSPTGMMGYQEVGSFIGADAMNIPDAVWAGMTTEAREAAMRGAIDTALDSGRQIAFTTNPAATGSANLAYEYNYIVSLKDAAGNAMYRVVQNGTGYVVEAIPTTIIP